MIIKLPNAKVVTFEYEQNRIYQAPTLASFSKLSGRAVICVDPAWHEKVLHKHSYIQFKARVLEQNPWEN